MDDLGTYAFTMTSDSPGWTDLTVKISGIQGYVSEGIVEAIGQDIADRITASIDGSGNWFVSGISVLEQRTLNT